MTLIVLNIVLVLIMFVPFNIITTLSSGRGQAVPRRLWASRQWTWGSLLWGRCPLQTKYFVIIIVVIIVFVIIVVVTIVVVIIVVLCRQSKVRLKLLLFYSEC